MRAIDADALMEAINTWPKFGVDERGRIVLWNKGYEPYIHLRYVVTAITEMPTIEPDPQWIPCNERLPDKETYVLISKKPHPLTGKKWCVTIAGRFVDGRSRKLEWRDIGFGRIVDDEILAWMPLPEPYKERREA